MALKFITISFAVVMYKKFGQNLFLKEKEKKKLHIVFSTDFKINNFPFKFQQILC
jgi:hypothetical protein